MLFQVFEDLLMEFLTPRPLDQVVLTFIAFVKSAKESYFSKVIVVSGTEFPL